MTCTVTKETSIKHRLKTVSNLLIVWLQVILIFSITALISKSTQTWEEYIMERLTNTKGCIKGNLFLLLHAMFFLFLLLHAKLLCFFCFIQSVFKLWGAGLRNLKREEEIKIYPGFLIYTHKTWIGGSGLIASIQLQGRGAQSLQGITFCSLQPLYKNGIYPQAFQEVGCLQGHRWTKWKTEAGCLITYLQEACQWVPDWKTKGKGNGPVSQAGCDRERDRWPFHLNGYFNCKGLLPWLLHTLLKY